MFITIQNRIDDGLKMIQVREKDISLENLKMFSKEVVSICKPQGVKVIINSYVDLAYEIEADGVHLTSKDLHNIKKRPQDLIVSASCHTQEDFNIADKMNINNKADLFQTRKIYKLPRFHSFEFPEVLLYYF